MNQQKKNAANQDPAGAIRSLSVSTTSTRPGRLPSPRTEPTVTDRAYRSQSPAGQGEVRVVATTMYALEQDRRLVAGQRREARRGWNCQVRED